MSLIAFGKIQLLTNQSIMQKLFTKPYNLKLRSELKAWFKESHTAIQDRLESKLEKAHRLEYNYENKRAQDLRDSAKLSFEIDRDEINYLYSYMLRNFA